MKVFIGIILFLVITIRSVSGQTAYKAKNKYVKKKEYKKTNKCEHIGKVKVTHYKHKKVKTTEEVAVITRAETAKDTASHKHYTALPVNIAKEDVVADIIPEAPHPDPVYFRFDSDKLDSIDYNQVLLAVEHIKNGGKKVKLHGHTDSHGHEGYNLRLSKNRAHKVKELLLSLGVEEEHIIEVIGFGESQPATHNNTAQSRMLNRRVEFVLHKL